MDLIVRELGEQDESAFQEGFAEWEGEDQEWHAFSWMVGLPFDQMLSTLQKESKGVDLAPGRVPHTMLYGFLDGKIIGRISIRHELNDYLLKRGGHIGYAVAPKFRKRGYATELVCQGLKYCTTLGLSSVLITCSDTNTPSWKIIERFGGQLENKIWDDEDKEMLRRYWVSLSSLYLGRQGGTN